VFGERIGGRAVLALLATTDYVCSDIALTGISDVAAM
jgi:hypothetical protein